MEPANELTEIQLGKEVAVFGGDDRVFDLEGMYPGNIRVDAYPGRDSDAARLAESLKSGNLSHVILLVRWLAHPQYRTICDSAKAAGAKVIAWRFGLGRLGNEIVRLVADGSDHSLSEVDEALIGIGDPGEADEPPENEVVSLQRQARDAGMTVACFCHQHDACGFKGKRKVKCGCDCHANDVVDDEPQPELAPPPFSVSGEKIIELLGLEPSKEWSVSEIAALLDAKDQADHESLQSYVASLVETGDLVAVGPVRLIPSSISAVKLPAKPGPEQIPQETPTPATMPPLNLTLDLVRREDREPTPLDDVRRHYARPSQQRDESPFDVLSLLPEKRRAEIYAEALACEVRQLLAADSGLTLGNFIARLRSHPHWTEISRASTAVFARWAGDAPPNQAAATCATPVERTPSAGPADLLVRRRTGVRSVALPRAPRRLAYAPSNPVLATEAPPLHREYYEKIRARILDVLATAPNGLTARRLAKELMAEIAIVRFALTELGGTSHVHRAGSTNARWFAGPAPRMQP